VSSRRQARAWREAARKKRWRDTRVTSSVKESAVAQHAAERPPLLITFRIDELTDAPGQVKGNRGKFAGFTANFCRLPQPHGPSSRW
jgi:hypothetical protein